MFFETCPAMDNPYVISCPLPGNGQLLTCPVQIWQPVQIWHDTTNSLDEYTEASTSYISCCADCCIPSHTRVSYNNDKPWFTAKLRQLRLQKEDAFRSGDRGRFKKSKYSFSKA